MVFHIADVQALDSSVQKWPKGLREPRPGYEFTAGWS